MQHREQMYWMVNAGMLMVCAAVIAVCVPGPTAVGPGTRLLVALAPAFALTATINWDLLAIALTAAAMLMWSRGRTVPFGVFIGLATAAKLYPVLLLGAAVRALLAGRKVAGVRAAALGAAGPGWW